MRNITFAAKINLQAAASGKQRRFSILAYSGGSLRVDGFPVPVIVDLQGLESSASIPILIDHRATVEATLGLTDSIQNDGRSLTLSGLVTGVSATAQQVLAQSSAGHTWQASIGASVVETEDIAAGQKVFVNGQTFVGPVIVARRSVLKETSVLPMGADSSTSVNLAARAALSESKVMTFEEFVTSLGLDVATLTPEASSVLQIAFDAQSAGDAVPEPVASAAAVLNLRSAATLEATRIREIQRLAHGHPEVLEAAIANGWDTKDTEIHVLKASSRKGHIVPSNRSFSGTVGAPDATAVLTASLAMSCGGSPAILAKSFGEKVVDAATAIENRGASLRTVCEHVLRAAGVVEHSNRMTDSYIRAAFQASTQLEAAGMSTVSLPGILGNTANKLLLEGYSSVPTTWQNFCVVGDLKDFKESSRYRMIGAGDFEEVGPGGQIKHLNLTSEQTYSNRAKTYARMVNLTRQDIINDDLGAFEQIPAMLGRKAVIKLEKTVYSLLLANTGSFFAVGNNNYFEGAATSLQISSLTTAELKFLNQTDENGDPVLVMPSVLLVPTSLSVTSNQLTRDTQVVAVGAGGTAAVVTDGNPHAGRFSPVVTPWLENAGLTGYSAVGWYLLAKPQGKAGLMEVAFLNGQSTPTIEDGDLDFSTLGVALRGYWDFGVAFQDPRFGVRSKGQA